MVGCSRRRSIVGVVPAGSNRFRNFGIDGVTIMSRHRHGSPVPTAPPDRSDAPNRPGERQPLDGRSESTLRPPRPAPGEVLRLRDAAAPVRFLWPTVEATPYPYVGVVIGPGGHRFPIYLESAAIERFGDADAVVVDAETVPVEAPPHAALGE